MAVTGVSSPGREPLETQIAKIVHSDVLKGSESLCRLLRYLADQSLEHPGASVKEYQIAIDVFSRPADFDPRLDSTVRVQTSRLRSKLSEYYAVAGLEDRMIVEIPKGSYSLAVHPRPPQLDSLRATEPLLVEQPHPEPPPPSGNIAIWPLSFLCVGLAVALLYVTLIQRKTSTPSVPEAPASLRTFWKTFVDTPDQPWIIFSNAEFVGRPETGMRYFDPKRDDRGLILDHYTGVGEVTAVHELDHLFQQLHHEVVVKRGRLLSMDDAKSHDLIFIGSPSENLTLRDLPTTQEFVFRTADKGPRKGDLGIFNLKPKSGEDSTWFGSPQIPIAEDYALIGLVPGITNAQWVLILAGTTTIGTHAAVEYVCRTQTVDKLLRRVGRSTTGELMSFEAVIRVKVSHGVPVGSELVALHARGS